MLFDLDLPLLPIHTILPELQEKIARHQSVILSAEPGSGKTTIVPLALANEPWLQEKKIIMLEPRRLAARMAAKRMSELAGDTIGGLIGYRIRFDKKVSNATQIEVVTEGIFLRMIQNDPELSEVGLVIFDEFHVRSIQSDMALALCTDVLELRSSLKIMIMSATMDSVRVSNLLGHAPIITGEGRCFPVKTVYRSRPDNDYLVPRTVKAIHHAIQEHDGSILVFLPGAGEIKAVQNKIEAKIQCLALYGDLAQHKQDMVFAPTGKRRVILATPIAETSLTIEGVSVVIDSGLMKIPRFSSANGLTSLHTVSISKASADQRSGRAGRLGPGICYRLWTKAEQHSKTDFLAPEIIGADLSPLLLEVLQWGVKDPAELTWLDPPRTAQVEQARGLLVRLGAIDSRGGLSKKGKQIASLPLHPRLALMLLYGREHGKATLACRLAALLQNRDLFRRGDKEQSADIEDRLDILRLFDQKETALIRAKGADTSQCRRVLREADQYQRLLGIKGRKHDFLEAGNLLAIAYPDRIAKKKPGSSQHLLASGRGVVLSPHDHLQQADFLVAANVDGGKKQGKIFLAAALSLDEILHEQNHLLVKKERVEWKHSKVEAVSILSLGSLEIKKEALAEVDPEQIQKCLLKGIQQTGIDCLNWQKKSRELQARIQTAHDLDPKNWPDVSDNYLTENISWIEPYLDSMSSLKQLKKLDLHSILLALLPWKDQQALERLLPTHYQAPSGSKIKLQYTPGESPVLAVRLQEMFGATESPHIYNGKVPLLIHLLSPARRPVQVTADLASFWRNTYPQVKKELAGRYPKHYWPDDPLIAQATARCKPRK
ncbi:MAG: ATP-dependent helicase HrpB [Thermodesulfobacteriota bacterium]|nr:ATP-dependent helicase HrpB [Thermodesulfobacteriota bacterium]